MASDKYGWLPEQIRVLTPCISCLHFRKNANCDAFPKGIPEKILDGNNKHRKAYPGDHGIRFEPIPTGGK
jgi:hypothetical protein